MSGIAGRRTGQRLFLHGSGHGSAGGERALLLADRDDLVCVSEAVDPVYLDYLGELGLGPAPANVIVAPTVDAPVLGAIVERLSPSGSITLHPHAGTDGAFAVADGLERAAGRPVRVLAASAALTRQVAHRHRMRQEAIALGIPVPDGEVAELAFAGGRRRRDLEPVRAAVERQLRRTGRVLVRGTSDESGCSAFVVGQGGRADDTDGLLRKLALRSDNLVYLVEVLVEATTSPTVQLVVEPEPGEIRCVAITDQRWVRGLSRAGHAQPSLVRSPDVILEWSLRLGRRLRDQGYAGPLSLDFVEYREGESSRSILAGVAPGVDQSAYPAALRERLGAAAFVSGLLATRARSFADLRQALGALLYRPSGAGGVVPCDTAGLAEGRSWVVALGGSRLHAAELLAKAQAAAGG